MHLLRCSLPCVLVLFGCRNEAVPHETPKPTPTVVASAPAAVVPSAAPSTVASAQLPAPPSSPTRPSLLRRVTPKKVSASSFLTQEKPRSNWVPQLAIDRQHQTAWQAGAGSEVPWIEATFDKPVKLWAVRSDAGWVSWGQLEKSARAKRVQLRLDDKDTYELAVDKEAHAADFLGIEQTVTRVRLAYPETWPGAAGAPLAISEISFWADASDAPSVPTKMVEDELAQISGDDSVAKAKAVLLRFGVAPRGEAESATATLHPPIGSGVRVLEVTMKRVEGTFAAYVFVAEIERDGMKRLIGLDSELLDQPGVDAPTMTLAKAHEVNGSDDVILGWSIPREDKPSLHGLRVITLARGAVERVADFLDERTPHLDGENPHEGTFDVVLDKTETKPLWRNRFDDRAYWYW
ncbi:MAG: discoidin domain-containing protein [Polyangiales bacterium]